MLAPELTLGAGGSHALAGTHADEVGLELGKGGQDVEEHLAHGVGRIVDRLAQRKFRALGIQLIGYGSGIRYRTGEAVQLGNDQGVPLAYRGEGLVESRAGTAGSRQAVVREDVIGRDSEALQGLALALRSCLSVEQRA